MNTLNVTNLSKSYGKKMIVNDMDLRCSTGEIIGVFGSNGTGKSTLLQCIFGTLKANEIRITIDDKHIVPRNVISSKQIGYLPQDSFLPKGRKVREVIPLVFPNGDDQDRIFYAQGIHAIENSKVGKLSMGELRYLEVLLLCHLKHRFLLLDEPFSMIQPSYKELIKGLLFRVKKEKGIIVTDHYYEDVLAVSDRNMLLKNGKLLVVEGKGDLIIHGYLRS